MKYHEQRWTSFEGAKSSFSRFHLMISDSHGSVPCCFASTGDAADPPGTSSWIASAMCWSNLLGSFSTRPRGRIQNAGTRILIAQFIEQHHLSWRIFISTSMNLSNFYSIMQNEKWKKMQKSKCFLIPGAGFQQQWTLEKIEIYGYFMDILIYFDIF